MKKEVQAWFRRSLSDKTGQTLTLHRYGTNNPCGRQQPYDVVTGVGARTWRT